MVALTFDQARACVLTRSRRVDGDGDRSRSRKPQGTCWRKEDRRGAATILRFPALPAMDLRCGLRTCGELRIIGEVRAGEAFSRSVAAGEAVEIMTGAPVPAGADAVVMVEHTERIGEFG